MTKQASFIDPADDLTQLLGPDLAKAFTDHRKMLKKPMTPGDLFRRGKCKNLGLAYIEFHSIPEPNTGCWLWLGALDRANYPRTRRRDIDDQYAHRYSLSCVIGSLGDLHALHRCDNPICVNPGHLFAGTNIDNNKDMMAKGRDRHPKGEENGLSVLSESQVREIRASYRHGVRGFGAHVLGKKYGVTTANIRSIIQRHSWGWLQ